MSDFTGGSFSVQRGPNNDEACTASWSWVKPVHFLEELGFVGERPVRTPGVALSWSSRRGPEGGWSYTVVSDSGMEESGRLPVPALADPAVIVGMMPALRRGRHRQLRASEDRWEWAAGVESSTESARLLSEDKSDLDYQLDEEECENFNQWQAQLEGTQQQSTAQAPGGESGGSAEQLVPALEQPAQTMGPVPGSGGSPAVQELSSDPIRRASQYHTVGTNARLQVFALLQAQGVPANEADDLVAALAAGAVAGAECEVAELAGMAPGSRGAVFEDGWDDAVRAMSEALVGIAAGPGAVAGRPEPLNWPYTSRT